MREECKGIPVLIVDDEPLILSGLQRSLGSERYSIRTARSVEEGKRLLLEAPTDICLVDFLLTGGPTGDHLIRWGLANNLVQRAYCFTADPNHLNTMAALRAGCLEVVAKPVHSMEQLHALFQSGRRSDSVFASWRAQYAHNILGEDPKIINALNTIANLARTNLPVLFTGESGTGKELFARAIHDASERRNKPFVALNCAAIPETLIESELFGHTKGAFTGSSGARDGHILSANGGTLFLDELGDMPLAAQAKLLRVLQDGKLTPVGADRSLDVNVRIVAATNKNLREEIAKNTFRKDLFFRVGGIQIELPPLRERRGDIPALARTFLRKFNSQLGNDVIDVDEGAESLLCRHHWPGNIRELDFVMHCAVALKRSGIIRVGDLGMIHLVQSARNNALSYESGSAPEEGHSERESAQHESITTRVYEEFPTLKSAVEAREKELLMLALERTGGNRTEAAALLGLNRTTLVEKLRKLAP
jgi:DNA-binding NtrC family response regulator